MSGGGAPTPAPLSSYYDTATRVKFTAKNAVQASSTHREVEITVGGNLSTITIYSGYQGQIVRTKSYAMNDESYRAFLKSLEITGNYTAGNHDPEVRDETGYCALGERYTYEIIDPAGEVTQHLWSTSCGPKTFAGNADAVQELFTLQIPDYSDITDNVEF